MLIAVGLTGSRQGIQVLDGPVWTQAAGGTGSTARFLIQPVLTADEFTGSRQGRQVLDCPLLTVDGLRQLAGRQHSQVFD